MSVRSHGLEVLSEGRDNNLNLIRMVAAAMVLVSHSYVVSSGNPHSEPWAALLGMTPGGIAVDAFFVLSGFLVMGSLSRSDSLWSFAVARSLRIYPGLWTALLVSTLVIGAAFSTLDFGAFMLNPQTWRYLIKNSTMIAGAEALLPEAFTHNPFAEQVNASLWTLRWELRLYLLLGLMWWCAGRLRGESARRSTMSAMVLGTAAVLLAATFALLLLGRPNDAPRLGAMFFWGATYWIHRHRVQLYGSWAAGACLAMVAGAAVSPQVFELVYRLSLPYLLMYLAFVPGGGHAQRAPSSGIRVYNRLGDYSYGTYVYAFPVQQAVAALMPGVSTWILTAVAGGGTLLLAVLSWHVIEKPAMKSKRFIPGHGIFIGASKLDSSQR